MDDPTTYHEHRVDPNGHGQIVRAIQGELKTNWHVNETIARMALNQIIEDKYRKPIS